MEPLELVLANGYPEELTEGRYCRGPFVLRHTSKVEYRHTWQRKKYLVRLSSDVELQRVASSFFASDRE